MTDDPASRIVLDYFFLLTCHAEFAFPLNIVCFNKLTITDLRKSSVFFLLLVQDVLSSSKQSKKILGCVCAKMI